MPRSSIAKTAVGNPEEDPDGPLGPEAAANVELVLGRLKVSDRKVIKDVQDQAIRYVEETQQREDELDWKEREDGSRYRFHHYCYAGDEPGQVKMLIQDKLAPLTAVTDLGRTPLHYAVMGGHSLIVDLLLAGGADPCAIDNRGLTTLHMASTKGYSVILRALLAAGATSVINKQAAQLKESPLMMACAGGHLEAVKVLREFKANIGLWSVTAENVVDVARRFGHQHIVEFLLKDMEAADSSRYHKMRQRAEERHRQFHARKCAVYAEERAERHEQEVEWIRKDRRHRAKQAAEAEIRRKEALRVARELHELHAKEYAGKSRQWCEQSQNRRAQVGAHKLFRASYECMHVSIMLISRFVV